jgi:hypothetical protein
LVIEETDSPSATNGLRHSFTREAQFFMLHLNLWKVYNQDGEMENVYIHTKWNLTSKP